MTRNPQLNRAYRDARKAMLDCLAEGFVDAEPLRAMQAAMAAMKPNRRAFGPDRYDELRQLLSEVEQLPIIEPVFTRHPPVINHRPEKWHHTVPYPYRFKWDGPWLFVLFLFAGGFAFKPLWLIGGFIALVRCWVYLCFRFPLTSWFVFGLIQGLLGGGRRRW